jgi:hypothetical protein
VSGLDIEGALASAQVPDARRGRAQHPKGFEPGVKFSIDSGLPESAVISSTVELDAEDHRAKIEEQTGLTVPPNLDVRLERLTLQNGAGGVVERWWYKYVFVVRTTSALLNDYDHLAALKSLRSNRKAVKPAHTGASTFVASWNDWQTGKQEGGGTPALLERYDRQVQAAKVRAAELRKIGRNLGRLVIIGGGDMVEGCTIFPHQMMHVDADRRKQINVTTDMILHGLDELAPLFESVTVLVVGGNHGENRIDGNRVNRTDNDDCAVFEHAARTAGRDDRLAHVDFVIAQGEPAKTLDINGWVYATTHGQAFGKGAGRPEQKAHNWYKGQAGGRFPAGDADVLVSHHYHHKAERDWGACLWVQTPANDGGSLQHTDLTGEAADAGMLTWVVTDACRYQDAQVLA